MTPCEWPADYGACALPEEWLALAEEERARFETMASTYLWEWTGRMFGRCPVRLRPCRTECHDGESTWGGHPATFGRVGAWRPELVAGQWYNLTCGACGDKCGCGGASPLRLPGEVAEVTEVVLDGQPLAKDAWRLDGSLLVRLDGSPWPQCQDMTAEDNAPGAWYIDFLEGQEVPLGGRAAAGVLALELWRASCGDPECGLPQRLQSITRQGVTVAVLDSFDDIDKGHTGIWLIDSWVASVMQPRRVSVVFSPDVPPKGRLRLL